MIKENISSTSTEGDLEVVEILSTEQLKTQSLLSSVATGTESGSSHTDTISPDSPFYLEDSDTVLPPQTAEGALLCDNSKSKRKFSKVDKGNDEANLGKR